MKSDKYLGCGACSVFIILYLLITLVDAFFIQYGLSAWVTYFGKGGNVSYWPCLIVAVIPFIGQLAIPFAAITFILIFIL